MIKINGSRKTRVACRVGNYQPPEIKGTNKILALRQVACIQFVTEIPTSDFLL